MSTAHISTERYAADRINTCKSRYIAGCAMGESHLLRTLRFLRVSMISATLLVCMLACSKKASQTNLSAPLRLTLKVSPDHPSMTKPITFDVHVENPQGQAVSDAQVTGALSMKLMDMGVTQLTFTPKGDGNYEASAKGMDMSGPWSLVVSASQGSASVEQSFDVTVGD